MFYIFYHTWIKRKPFFSCELFSMSLTTLEHLFAPLGITSPIETWDNWESIQVFFFLINKIYAPLSPGWWRHSFERRWREMLKVFLCKFRDNSFFPSWNSDDGVRMVLLKILKTFLWNSCGAELWSMLVFLPDAEHSFTNYCFHQNFTGFINNVDKVCNRGIKTNLLFTLQKHYSIRNSMYWNAEAAFLAPKTTCMLNIL